MAINKLIYKKVRLNKIRMMVLLLFAVGTISILSDCNNTSKGQYLNHHDTVKYVGMATCASCHTDKHSSFIHTGMAQSFDWASKAKSSAVFGKNHLVFDSFNQMWYFPYWKGDSLWIKEFILSGSDTIHELDVQIDYIVGSGQHTNSHLYQLNGFVYQAPLTFYTQESKWDLPPGFEKGNNSRFNRVIDVECMSCHNSMPEMHENSSKRFKSIGRGIDCERCHGPGELHVNLRKQGRGVNTEQETDFTIVNPAKLSDDLQIDLCQRCHLQGLNILKEGKKFTDFRPGMRLSDVFDVYLPEYVGHESSFDMANHSARFQKSECFIHSKSQGIDFSCISCHNPHISVTETSHKIYNAKCLDCHKSEKFSFDVYTSSNKHGGDCVDCHMPSQGTTDILHVKVHDHKISKPLSSAQKSEVQKLIGLYSVTSTEVSSYNQIKAYLEYWEKFDKNQLYLEKAHEALQKYNIPELWLKYYFLKEQYKQALNYVSKIAELDYWTAYMIAECYLKTEQFQKALNYFNLSYKMNSDEIDVGLKLAGLYLKMGDYSKASEICESMLQQFPMHGMLYAYASESAIKMGELERAKEYSTLALHYEPLNLKVWELQLNLSVVLRQSEKTKYWAKRILKAYPKHIDAEKIRLLASQ